MAIIDPPGDFFLARAEQAGGAGSVGYDQLDLTNLRVPDLALNIDGAITSAALTRTVEGASTLVLTLDDPGLNLTRSSVVDLNADGRLDPLLVELDILRWRLVKAEPTRDASTSELKLTFEEEAVALLRDHNAPLAMSRNAVTRAQFAHRLVREVMAFPIGFYSPEETFTQAIARPTDKTSRDAQRQPGFADGVKLDVKGVAADAAQKQEMETVLTVADERNATGRARQALIVAAIGESGFRAIPNAQGSGYAGVFQASPANIDPKDTHRQALHFLTGGLGFQAGGAIAAAAANPGWSAGTIAYNVEGDRSNFNSDQAAEHFYQKWIGEAHAILTAWNGTADGSGASNTRTAVKAYMFRRGLPGKRETSWDCLQRLASEVGWRCFCVANIVYFISEEQLFMSRARAEISLDTPGLNSLKTDWDSGKNAATVTLGVDAGAWSFPPGSIIALRDLGPFTGSWLVEQIDRADLKDPATTITLSKPIAKKREPAADTVQVPRDGSKASAARVKTKTAKYALSRKGTLIGKPYEGTHAKAFNIAGGSDNWESENAVDIGTPVGTTIIAVDDGTIGSEFGSLGTGGRFAGMRCHLETSGNEWYYAHLSSFAHGIGPGVKVKAGDTLGKSGEANGVAHLHLACKTGDPGKLLGLY